MSYLTYTVSIYNADDLTPNVTPTLFSIGAGDGSLAYAPGNIVEGPLTPSSQFGRVAFFSGPTTGTARIYIYEADGTFVRSFDSGCGAPLWLWYASDGTIYIAEDLLSPDAAAQQLQQFTERGALMRAWTISAFETIDSFVVLTVGSTPTLYWINASSFPDKVLTYDLALGMVGADIDLSFTPQWLSLRQPDSLFEAVAQGSDVLHVFNAAGASQGISDPDLGEQAQGQMKGRFLWFKTFASPTTDDVVIRCTKCDPDVVAATLSPNPTVNDDAFFFLVTGANEVILPCPGPPPTGTVYAMRRLRRFSLPFNENKRITLSRIEFICQTGIGNETSPNPVIWMRLSKDGGQTYGPMQQMAVGQIGQYFKRVFLTNQGTGRNWVCEASTMDAVASGWLDCLIEAFAGSS